MHISIDVDGILRMFLYSVVEEYEKHHPDKAQHLVDFEDINEWGMTKLATRRDVGEHLLTFSMEDPKTSFECFRNAQPWPGSLGRVKILYETVHDHGDKLSMITSQKTPWQRKATMEWLHEHEVPFDNVIMTATGKGDFGVDAILDDRTKNVLGAAEGGAQYPVLMNKPYNNADLCPYVVSDIDEYRKVIYE